MSKFSARYKNDGTLRKICREEGIEYLAVFGSYARGDEKLGSDLDILYRLQRKISYFQFYDMIKRLSEFFDKNVDAVSEKCLRKSFREAIADDLEVLYEDKE